MDAQEVVRKLVEAIEDQKYPLCETHACNSCDRMRDALSSAESWLKNGGWKCWPEEKPTDRDVYQVYCKPSESGYIHRTDLDWFGGLGAFVDSNKHWDDMEVVAWQPFPPLPETEK